MCSPRQLVNNSAHGTHHEGARRFIPREGWKWQTDEIMVNRFAGNACFFLPARRELFDRKEE
jgi:hypothetical protein